MEWGARVLKVVQESCEPMSLGSSGSLPLSLKDYDSSSLIFQDQVSLFCKTNNLFPTPFRESQPLVSLCLSVSALLLSQLRSPKAPEVGVFDPA